MSRWPRHDYYDCLVEKSMFLEDRCIGIDLNDSVIKTTHMGCELKGA